MKFTKKTMSLLLSVLLILSVFTIIPATTASADDGGSFTADVDAKWIKGEIAPQSWSADGIYSFGDLEQKVIFCRINKSAEEPSFANDVCYNQTADLTVPSENTWKMENWFSGTWYNYGLEGTVSGKYIDVRSDNARNDVYWYAWTWNTKTLTEHAAVPATYSTPGNVKYYTSDDNCYYIDDPDYEGSYKQVTQADIVIPAIGDAITGSTLVLKDEIVVNFYAYLEDTAAVTATYHYGTGSYEKTIDVTPESGDFSDKGGANCVFSCAINARAMTDTITLTINREGADPLTYDYRIVDYAQQLANQDAKYKTLMCAMLDYGAACQTFFNYNTSDSAADYIAQVDSDYTPLALNMPEAKSLTAINEQLASFNLQFVGSTLSATSKTRIRLFFKELEDGAAASVTVNGKVPYNNGASTYSLWCVDIDGISAKAIFDDYTIVIEKAGSQSIEGTYNAAGYYSAASVDAKPVVENMWRYYEAAKAALL